MSDNNSRKRQIRYNPGELDKTRKNLGDLSEAEARKMAAILGGEVGYEKTAKQSSPNASPKIAKTTAIPAPQGEPEKSETVSGKDADFSQQENSAYRWILPPLTKKQRKMFRKLCSASQYKIQEPFFFLEFLFPRQRKDPDTVSEDFILNILEEYIKRMHAFRNHALRLLASAQQEAQKKILTGQKTYMRFFRVLKEWDPAAANSILTVLQRTPSSITVTKLIPLVHNLFRPLCMLLFLGETNMLEIIKIAYSNIRTVSGTSQELLKKDANTIAGDWVYIYKKVIPGLYPLLLRICSSDCLSMQTFFNTRLDKIMSFLNITKYDILVMQPDQEDDDPLVPAPKPQPPQAAAEQNLLATGLKLLDSLFPGAGWLTLDSSPDFFPYFQPLYKLPEGFNLLAPENPLQVTLVLICIIEDLFKGFGAIDFIRQIDVDMENDFSQQDTKNEFTEWYLFRSQLFFKEFAPLLNSYVNQVYAQKAYRESASGKRRLAVVYWFMKTNFFPHLRFDQMYSGNEAPLTKQRPFPKTVSKLLNIVTHLCTNIDTAFKSEHGGIGCSVLGINNPWDTCIFDPTSLVSERLMYLLKTKNPPMANNAGLLMSTQAILTVLNWWTNETRSGAYTREMKFPYRMDKSTGEPVFTIIPRADQEQLFAEKYGAKTPKNE